MNTINNQIFLKNKIQFTTFEAKFLINYINYTKGYSPKFLQFIIFLLYVFASFQLSFELWFIFKMINKFFKLLSLVITYYKHIFEWNYFNFPDFKAFFLSWLEPMHVLISNSYLKHKILLFKFEFFIFYFYFISRDRFIVMIYTKSILYNPIQFQSILVSSFSVVLEWKFIIWMKLLLIFMILRLFLFILIRIMISNKTLCSNILKIY